MPCISPFYQKTGGWYGPVPCGRCPECKLRRVQQWAFRLVQEDKVSSSGMFITLTYSDAHVPITNTGYMSLEKAELQKFIKRLRKRQRGQKLKYYAVGEYSPKPALRPHYHMILFNLADSKFIGKDQNGISLFTNKDVDNSWKHGRNHIMDSSGAAAAYCAKYIDKDDPIPQFEDDIREKQFSTMSKGIGESYVTRETKKYHNLERTFLTDENGIKFAMPEYYKKLFYTTEERELIRDEAIHTMDLAQIKQRQEHYKTYVEEKYPHFMVKYDLIKTKLSIFNKHQKKRNGIQQENPLSRQV